jgi:TonB family protein
MKRTILFLTIFSLSTFTCFSQDTTWLSKSYNVVANKDSAASFYVIYKDKSDTQRVKIKNYTLKEGLVTEKNYYPYSPEKKLDGSYKKYKDGRLAEEILYLNDKQHGTHKTFYPDGTVKRNDIYEKGIFISGKCYTPGGNDTAWYDYQVPASFVGGADSLRKYISRNIRYPGMAKLDRIEGRVLVSFIVSIDGKIENSKVIKSVHNLLDKEALRMVSVMPDWIPGKIDGVPVKMMFQLPVLFQLSE